MSRNRNTSEQASTQPVNAVELITARFAVVDASIWDMEQVANRQRALGQLSSTDIEPPVDSAGRNEGDHDQDLAA